MTDKEESAAFFKYKYLSIIFNRDNVGEYPETFRVMRDLKKSGSSGYEPLRQFVSNRMTITCMNLLLEPAPWSATTALTPIVLRWSRCLQCHRL